VGRVVAARELGKASSTAFSSRMPAADRVSIFSSPARICREVADILSRSETQSWWIRGIKSTMPMRP